MAYHLYFIVDGKRLTEYHAVPRKPLVVQLFDEFDNAVPITEHLKEKYVLYVVNLKDKTGKAYPLRGNIGDCAKWELVTNSIKDTGLIEPGEYKLYVAYQGDYGETRLSNTITLFVPSLEDYGGIKVYLTRGFGAPKNPDVWVYVINHANNVIQSAELKSYGYKFFGFLPEGTYTVCVVDNQNRCLSVKSVDVHTGETANISVTYSALPMPFMFPPPLPIPMR